jgi:hypothetical protein
MNIEQIVDFFPLGLFTANQRIKIVEEFIVRNKRRKEKQEKNGNLR